MLEEIMNHIGPRVSREKALEILEAEAKPSWTSEYYLMIPVILFGCLAYTYGIEQLTLFLCLATLIAIVDYRHRRKRSAMATAIISLMVDDAEFDSGEATRAQQGSDGKPDTVVS